MPPSNMRYIAASLTNQIPDILRVDDNLDYSFVITISIVCSCVFFLENIFLISSDCLSGALPLERTQWSIIYI